MMAKSGRPGRPRRGLLGIRSVQSADKKLKRTDKKVGKKGYEYPGRNLHRGRKEGA